LSIVAALERLHAKHVLPGFADRSAEEREIEAVTTDITKVHRNSIVLGLYTQPLIERSLE
jgi:hypothetical protein